MIWLQIRAHEFKSLITLDRILTKLQCSVTPIKIPAKSILCSPETPTLRASNEPAQNDLDTLARMRLVEKRFERSSFAFILITRIRLNSGVFELDRRTS